MIEKLLQYSIDNEQKHIPSALSQYSYLKYVLPMLKQDYNIVIGKPFGSQAYYCIWEDMGYIDKGTKLSVGVKHQELPFVNYGEETLGNALGVGAGIALSSDKPTYVNLSDGSIQMGPTLEAIQFIGHNQLNMLVNVDCNDIQLTGSTKDIIGMDINKIADIFKASDWTVHVYDLDELNTSLFSISPAAEIIEFGIINQRETKKPTVQLFKTIKGAGVREMEENPVKWHYKQLFNLDEVTYD